MVAPSHRCRTVQQVLDRLALISRRTGRNTVYRGHDDRDNYRLVPNVFREDHFRATEHLLLSEIEAVQPHEFASDGSALERLVRMQHYELPTRILDISWNPLVALYFATSSNTHRVPAPPGSRSKTRTVERDGEVVCFHVDEPHTKYFDSDTVACMANLARLKQEQKQAIRRLGLDKARLNGSGEGRRLVHFINAEKPGFLPEIEPADLYRIVLVKPKQANRRIIAQTGGFFVFGLTERIDEGGADGIEIDRIVIPGEAKAAIRAQLDTLAIQERSMFPELDRSARYIKEKLKAGKTPKSVW